MNRATVLIAGAVVLLILAFASGLFVGKRNASSEARMQWQTALATADLGGELDPEKLPLLVDVAAVRFEVRKAEVVKQVSFGELDPQGKVTTLNPKEGGKIVAVTLVGTVPRRCRIATRVTQFAAVFETEEIDGEGRTTSRAEFAEAVAIDISFAGDHWINPDPRIQVASHVEDASGHKFPLYSMKNGTLTQYFNNREPIPLTLKLAFPLPENVHTFAIRYPTAALGKATVQTPHEPNAAAN